MKNEIIVAGKRHGKSYSAKKWADQNNAQLIKLSDMSEKANKMGGVIAWTGDRSDDGGFIMKINIPIK